jgi:hypothetical protein
MVFGTAADAADAIKRALTAMTDEVIRRRIKFLLIESSRCVETPPAR